MNNQHARNQDLYSVCNLSVHNIGAGGVNNKGFNNVVIRDSIGSTLAPTCVMRISRKRYNQLMIRRNRALGKTS